MKRYLYLFLLLPFMAVMSVSCKKEQTAGNPPNMTILEYIAQDTSLTLLEAAITRAGLDTLFSSGGPFTFFCPVDSAFAAAGITLDKINAANPDSLNAFLRYQIIYGRISSNDVVGFLKESVPSLDSTYSTYVTKNYFGIFVNGAQVESGNIEAGDGVVQKIGVLNTPPTQTVLQLIDSLPELSDLAIVVSECAELQSLFSTFSQYAPSEQNQGAGAFRGNPGFTVLAPTNQAFEASQYPTVSVIEQTPSYTFSDVFDNYCLNGFLFTGNFIGGYVLGGEFENIQEFGFPGSSSGPYAIAKDGVTILVGYPGQPPAGSGLPPQITKPNILGSNGVIQEIDEIF